MRGLQLACLIAVVVSSGCATRGANEPYRDVFDRPQNYVGRTMLLCGYVQDEFENSNIYPSRRAARANPDTGLGFISGAQQAERRPWHNKTLCREVEIVRTGCSEEMICHWSNFPYAARLARP